MEDLKSFECPEGLPEKKGMCEKCLRRQSCLETFDSLKGLTNNISGVLRTLEIQERQSTIGSIGSRVHLESING